MKDGYALYDGDTFITMGSIKEISQSIGVKANTVRSYLAPSHRKRTKKEGKVLIKIEDDEE